MVSREQDDEPTYEVGQEQLDAVDRMLEELDLDEQFDRVPAAFQIVERFEQQRFHQELVAQGAIHNNDSNVSNNILSNSHSYSSFINGAVGTIADGQSHQNMDVDDINARYNEDLVDQLGSSDDGEDPQPFGYIPLNQDNFSDDDDEDEDGEKDGEEHTEYNQMASDDEKDERDKDKRSDDEGEELGYDDYLHSVNSDGTLPIPVIPDAVQIELDKTDERLAEQIPEEDLKTIAMIMSSFTLPAPDWAKAIPEERWLPKIVHQSQIEESSAATTPASDSRS